MSKEKAITHINNVSKILGTKRVRISEATAKHLQNELCLAKKELEDFLSSIDCDYRQLNIKPLL